MSDKSPASCGRVSRRDFLFVAAAGGGAVLGASLIAAPAAAATKMPQKAVKYQLTPKGKARCDNCALWQAPSSCKLVDGTIVPSGWCVLYKAKS
jgi:anaerobic selenocysteine-containing dehydrogenase